MAPSGTSGGADEGVSAHPADIATATAPAAATSFRFVITVLLEYAAQFRRLRCPGQGQHQQQPGLDRGEILPRDAPAAGGRNAPTPGPRRDHDWNVLRRGVRETLILRAARRAGSGLLEYDTPCDRLVGRY